MIDTLVTMIVELLCRLNFLGPALLNLPPGWSQSPKWWHNMQNPLLAGAVPSQALAVLSEPTPWQGKCRLGEDVQGLHRLRLSPGDLHPRLPFLPALPPGPKQQASCLHFASCMKTWLHKDRRERKTKCQEFSSAEESKVFPVACSWPSSRHCFFQGAGRGTLAASFLIWPLFTAQVYTLEAHWFFSTYYMLTYLFSRGLIVCL